MLATPHFVLRYEILDKKSFNSQGIFHGVDYKSNPINITDGAAVLHDINHHYKQQLQQHEGRYYNDKKIGFEINNKSIILAGLGATAVSTHSPHSVACQNSNRGNVSMSSNLFLYIPFNYRKQQDQNQDRNLNGISIDDAILKTTSVEAFTQATMVTVSSPSTMITHTEDPPLMMLTPSVDMESTDKTLSLLCLSLPSAAMAITSPSPPDVLIPSASLETLTTTTTTLVSPADIKHANVLLHTKLQLEEDLLCIARGADIEKFELKGLLTLHCLPHARLFTPLRPPIINAANADSISSSSTSIDGDSQSLFTHLPPPLTLPFSLQVPLPFPSASASNSGAMKAPSASNPISSLFDDIDLLTNTTTSGNGGGGADKLSSGSIWDNPLVGGVSSSSSSSSRMSKDSVKYCVCMTGNPSSIERLEINKKFVKVTDELNKNNNFVIGNENSYSLETVDLSSKLLLANNHASTATSMNTANSDSSSSSSSGGNSFPLLKYWLSPGFKFLVLKAVSQVTLLPLASPSAVTDTAASHATSGTNNAPKTQPLKVNIQVRLNPNFKEKLSDVQVLVSIKKLLKQPTPVAAAAATHEWTHSSFLISEIKDIYPRGSYNKKDQIISWSTLTGAADPGSSFTVSAVVEMIPNPAYSCITTSATATAVVTATTNEYKLITSTVPVIVKGKYLNAIITKTRFNINKIDTYSRGELDLTKVRNKSLTLVTSHSGDEKEKEAKSDATAAAQSSTDDQDSDSAVVVEDAHQTRLEYRFLELE